MNCNDQKLNFDSILFNSVFILFSYKGNNASATDRRDSKHRNVFHIYPLNIKATKSRIDEILNIEYVLLYNNLKKFLMRKIYDKKTILSNNEIALQTFYTTCIKKNEPKNKLLF